MYCLWVETLDSGKSQTMFDELVWITCVEAQNSVQRTTVPQECSEFKVVEYNVMLWVKSLEKGTVEQNLIKWCRFHVLRLRTVQNEPSYHRNAQNSRLCSTMYCFWVESLEAGYSQTKIDEMVWTTCVEIQNSVESTSVPQDCSEFKVVQYNVLLVGRNP
jgi:hypothetical protein